jgi:hypothetical protein
MVALEGSRIAMWPTRRWAVLVVVAAMLAACTGAASSGDDLEGNETPGDAALFCRAWPDARAAISGESTFDLIGDQSVGIDQVMAYSDTSLTGIDAIVPTAIRAEWDRAYGFYRQLSGLFFVVGFDESAIHPVHLKMAFGDAGPEAASADAESAIATIDAWAAIECWDFCSQWPELNAILRIHEPANWHELERNVGRHEAALEAGDRLVPAQIERQWEIAAGYVRSSLEVARDHDLDPGRAGEGFDEVFTEHVGVDFGEAGGALDEAKEQISWWVEANCDATAVTAGGPGSVTVRLTPQDHLTARTLLLALLPAGTSFATVRSNDPYVAMTCTETDITPEDWDSMMTDMAPHAREQGIAIEDFVWEQLGEHMQRPLQPTRPVGEYHEASLCNLIEHEREAIIPGGNYELFVGTYIGDPGSYGLYLAAPERCAQIPVAVDGDTVVDLPQLTPCDLKPLGSPEEIARRTLPPVEAAASLHLQVDAALRPEGYAFCSLRAMLLPAGTTLNDVGRGDAWPSAMINFHRPDPREFDVGPDEQRWAYAPGLVPFLAAPPSGNGEIGLGPSIESDRPWDTRFPDPVPLAAGSYDLRVEELCIENEEEWDDQAEKEGRRCATITIEVDGATIVEMPELGACP